MYICIYMCVFLSFFINVFQAKICVFIVLATELVIYDNSCRLHEYCLNRDPAFFKNTKFVVDKFHWKNHSGILLIISNFNYYLHLDTRY